MRAHVAETKRLNRERRSSAESDRRELQNTVRSIKGILTAIEEGAGVRSLVTCLQVRISVEPETPPPIGVNSLICRQEPFEVGPIGADRAPTFSRFSK